MSDEDAIFQIMKKITERMMAISLRSIIYAQLVPNNTCILSCFEEFSRTILTKNIQRLQSVRKMSYPKISLSYSRVQRRISDTLA